MRVLLIVHGYPPRALGGTEIYASHLARTLRREDLLPTLGTLLRVHGFAAVENDDGYHVLPLGKAVRGQLAPQLGDSNAPIPPGFALRIVPLSYIAATEMAEILEPIVQGNSIVRIDNRRNLLILAGTGQELNYILDTIEVFDALVMATATGNAAAGTGLTLTEARCVVHLEPWWNPSADDSRKD